MTASTHRNRRTATRKPARRERKPPIPLLVGGLGILLVVGVLLGIHFLISNTSGTGPVSPALAQSLASIPSDVENTVGRGSATGLPTPVNIPMKLGPNGRPEVFFVGAEYCGQCAAERWALVVALDRFGSFSSLNRVRSAFNDPFPSISTFTFYGASYESDYIDLVTLEEAKSTQVAGAYEPLEAPSQDQQQMIRLYDSPPYVSQQVENSIPFVDFGNRYVTAGASFPPYSLKGKSWDEIAATLKDPGSPQARGIIGAANVFTAAICTLTSDEPADVCGQAAIQVIEKTLKNSSAPALG